MTDQEQEPWQEPWPEKMYLLHPSIKTFGAMVSNPERREYVRADRIEELGRSIKDLKKLSIKLLNEKLQGEWREPLVAELEAAEAKLTKALEERDEYKAAAEICGKAARAMLADLEGGE